MADRWIVIPNWGEFQHYSTRDPTWIKNYTRLLHDAAYTSLSASERGILHGLWLLFGSTDGVLTTTHSKHLLAPLKNDSRRFEHTLDRLNDAGFITFTASTPIALRYQRASAEKRSEEKTPKKVQAKPVDNQLLLAAIEVAAGWNGNSSEDFDRQLTELEREHDGRLTYLQREELWETALHQEHQ